VGPPGVHARRGSYGDLEKARKSVWNSSAPSLLASETLASGGDVERYSGGNTKVIEPKQR
jgi:hypothetical protein